MQTLVEGVHYFQNVGFPKNRQMFARLAKGQSPLACFITCSDSRIDPNLITNTRPGELFIVRNVGNVIPCFGTSNNGEMAAVEFAIVALGVQDIIVCGHTLCGAMKALLNPRSMEKVPSVREWLRHADATSAIVKEHYDHLKDDALLTATAEENVLVQLEHLRSLPAVAARVSKGTVRLHGWMYKIESGEVFAYDSETRQFAKFGAEDVKRVAGSKNGQRNGHQKRRVAKRKSVSR